MRLGEHAGILFTMSMNLSYWIVGAVTLVVVLGGSYLFLNKSPVAPIEETAQATSTGYAISPLPDVPLPEYREVFVCASSVPASLCTKLKLEAPALIQKIDANPGDAAAWVNLGAMRKLNQDYQGAAEVWIFVTKLQPGSPVAYANLGDLYMNFLKDYKKAEANYLLAIKYAADDANLYQNLFTLYTTTSYNPSPTAAEDILKKGIAVNQNAVNLRVALARYYTSLGRAADAKAEYDAAIKSAEAQGNTSLAAQIKTEAGE